MSTNPNFITDAGHPIKWVNNLTGEERTIPRYGAWVFLMGRGKYECVECSDDLNYLKTVYQTSDIYLLHKSKDDEK